MTPYNIGAIFGQNELQQLAAIEYFRNMQSFPQNGLSNIFKTAKQRKLDAAKEYLKSRAHAHPEWNVSKT